MRRVKKGSAVWKRVGVGSGDVGWLLNCSPESEENCLALWARIVGKREATEVKKVQLDQGTPDWLDWRKKGLGGSEVGCVLGCNPYSDSKADRVWARKLPSDHPDALPEVKSNYAMQRGQKLEPEARRLYEELYGWKAEPVCVVHDDYEFIRASLDGLRHDDKVAIEAKCSGQKNHARYLECCHTTDPVERQQLFWSYFPYYHAQIQYQLLITQAEVCHFLGYSPDFGGSDRLAIFELYPEIEGQQRLLDRVVEFWSFVENRTPPPPEWMVRCDRCPEAGDLRIPEVK
jgi:putative phage-type endonuclease